MNKKPTNNENLPEALGIKDSRADEIIDYVRECYTKKDQDQLTIIKAVNKKYRVAAERSFANYVLGRISEKSSSVNKYASHLLEALTQPTRPSNRQTFMSVISALTAFTLMFSATFILVSLVTEGFELWKAVKMVVDVMFAILIVKWNLEA